MQHQSNWVKPIFPGLSMADVMPMYWRLAGRLACCNGYCCCLHACPAPEFGMSLLCCRQQTVSTPCQSCAMLMQLVSSVSRSASTTTSDCRPHATGALVPACNMHVMQSEGLQICIPSEPGQIPAFAKELDRSEVPAKPFILIP